MVEKGEWVFAREAARSVLSTHSLVSWGKELVLGIPIASASLLGVVRTPRLPRGGYVEARKAKARATPSFSRQEKHIRL